MSIAPLVDRVQTTLAHLGRDSSVEEVMELCPELTCNQVFLAIDHLNRTGTVRVTVDAERTYRIQTIRLWEDEHRPVVPDDPRKINQESRVS